MRVTRAKFYRKYLRFYRIVYNIVAPYNVLIDGNFVFAAIKNKVDIQERLRSVLQGDDFALCALRSTLAELEIVRDATSASAIVEDSECRSEFKDGNAITVSDRTVSFLRSLHQERLERPSSRIKKYLLVTQDKELRSRVGAIPGVPLIYLNKVTLILEPPSTASREFNQQVEAHKTSMGSAESSVMKSMDLPETAAAVAYTSTQLADRYAHKKKASGPNPLSSARARAGSNKSKKRKIDKFRR